MFYFGGLIMKEREVWVDNVKVIACVLVVLGHFFQSMTKANILPANALYQWFNQTIYYFHVPLFFICSGYLYQNFFRVHSLRNWGAHVLNKFISLGIPYFIFSIVTLILKKLFEGSVNTPGAGFLETLFFNPIAPYWYLYVLFFIFLVTPTFNSKKNMIIALIVALIMKAIIIAAGDISLPYLLDRLLNNQIWFVAGMCMKTFKWNEKLNAKTSLLGVLFLVLSIYIYNLNISFKGMGFLLGVMACISVISIIYYIFRENKQNKMFGILAKYTLPIFVMHTIFAAGFRSILLKLGVSSTIMHVTLGLIVSFVLPIIAAWIMSKTKFSDALLYPGKYIRIKIK